MKVVKKQNNSKMCIICGKDNASGICAPFYEMEDQSIYTIFQFKENHQSYPNRTHGGMITAMLDELGLRSIWPIEENTYGVTLEICTKFRKPVPYNVTLKGIGKVIYNSQKFIKSIAKICNINGETLAEAEIKYIKLPVDKIVNDSNTNEDAHNVFIPDNVTDIE